MKYLLFLNRFDLNLDKLKSKISSKLKDSKFYEDEKYTLMLETNQNIKEILNFQEIRKICPLYSDWKKLASFKDFRNNIVFNVKKSKIKTYSVATKFLSKVPISSKSIYKRVNTALKFEGLKYNESPEGTIYIEFKKADKILSYRVFIITLNLNKINVIKVDMDNIHIALENPESIEEISDFLRLSYIFKLKLIFLTNNNITSLIEKAKEATKGIDYSEFKFEISKELPKNIKKIGFTKHSSQNEKDLQQFFKSNKDKFILVFGNEKYGLSQELRDSLDSSFHLTPEEKKPLRASHALSYILGFYTNIFLK